MALVTNNISGSSAGAWRIGVTGSVTIANPGTRPFPTVPGTDVDLFVSGTIGGVGAGQGVTLFGGDVVISGTLHGGSPLKIGTDVGVTGSLALNNVASAPTAGANEAVLYARAGTLYFKNAGGSETAVGSGGGGGGSGGPFTEASNVAAYTTSSIAIGQQAVASTKGTDVFFFVSGSTDGQKAALFGGPVITSGSFQVTSNSGEIAHIAGNGEISGSGNLKAGGNLTVAGTALVVGTSTLTGDVTFGGLLKASDGNTNITLTSNSLTTFAGDIKVGGNDIQASDGNINIAMTSNTLTEVKGDLQVTGNDIKMNGGTVALTFSGTGDVAVAGDLKVTGNDIQASDGNVNIAMTSNTLTEVKGDLQVTGNDVKMSGGTVALTFSGTGDVAVTGDLTVTGNDIKSSTATALTLDGANVTAAGNLTVTGDLTVNGTTTTVNTTNLLVKDPLIYLASASAATPVTYGGIAIASGSGVTNEALVFFRDTNGGEAIWSSARQDVQAGSALTAGVTNYLPIRASRFELGGTLGGGTTAFVTASMAGVVDVQGSQVRIISTASPLVLSGATGPNNGVQIRLNGLTYGQIKADGNNITFGSPANFATLSGSTVQLQHGTAGGVDFLNNTAGYFRINSGPTATQLLGNSDADVLIAPWSSATSKSLYLSGTNVSLSGSNSVNFYSNAERFAYVGLSPTSNLKGLHPSADSTYNLGSPQLRWANIYTGDLHLRNERGDWTIIEERDYLSITNNYNGKRYKFVLEEI